MIQRFVLFKLVDKHCNDADRREIAAYTRRAITTLPGVQSVDVGVPADEASTRSWDLSLVVYFDDVDAIAAYAEHPDHRRFVDEYMKPRVEVVKAWNFELTEK